MAKERWVAKSDMRHADKARQLSNIVFIKTIKWVTKTAVDPMIVLGSIPAASDKMEHEGKR